MENAHDKIWDLYERILQLNHQTKMFQEKTQSQINQILSEICKLAVELKVGIPEQTK